MGGTSAAGQERRWGDLMMELWPVISAPLTWEGERLLLDLIRFEGRLRLDVSSEMPHSIPPEDMLKSLAIQALAQWTGLAHLCEMQRVQLTTRSPSLASLVRDVIQKASATRSAVRKRSAIEEIAESASEAVFRTVFRPLEKDQVGGMVEVTTEESVSKTVFRPLEKDQGMSFVAGHRIRVRDRERELVS